MEKNWIIWTSSVFLALGLIFTGCGEKKTEETSAPPETEQPQPTAETAPTEGTVTPAGRDQEGQEQPKGDVIKEGAQGDVIRP